jgi:hypothetical protein
VDHARQPAGRAARAAAGDQYLVPGVRRASGGQRDPHRRPVAGLPLPAMQLLLQRVAYGAREVLVLRRHVKVAYQSIEQELPRSRSTRPTIQAR